MIHDRQTPSTQASSAFRAKGPSQAAPHGDDRSQAHSQDKPCPLIDGFEYSAKDLTDDKRIPVLVTLPDKLYCSKPSLDSQTPTREPVPFGSNLGIIPPGKRFELPLINGFSTYIEPNELPLLAQSLPEGSHLSLNGQIHYADIPTLTSDDRVGSTGMAGRVERLPNLDKVWDQGYTGKGQKIVIIDSGVAPHPDLKDKLVEWVDFSKANKPKPFDDYGHGTHVAGVAAGAGIQSHGEIKGIAPDADIVGLRITTVAEAIKALQWCVDNKDAMNLKVINMSLGEVARRGAKFDPWALAVQKATEAGLIVCVAAGNEGPNPGSISTPGIYPGAITVGAYDSKGTPTLADDTVWKNSSQGPTIDGVQKPDVLAPGVAIFGPLSAGSQLDNEALPHRGQDYFAISGTSQATPMISGLVALLLEARPELTVDQIKAILKQSSGPAPIHPATGKPALDGAGLVDAEKALTLALAEQTTATA